MDLELYQRHQMSLRMAGKAGSEPARAAHQALADGYAPQVLAVKRSTREGDADRALVVAFRNVEIVA